jgi:hypothetical protein
MTCAMDLTLYLIHITDDVFVNLNATVSDDDDDGDGGGDDDDDNDDDDSFLTGAWSGG